MEEKELRLYLDRIGLKEQEVEDLSPTVDTLRLIHQSHAFHIPFENLDPVLGKPVSLEPSTLFQQLVTNKRGGYCFQQNALFNRALQRIGFQVKPVAARVLWGIDRTNLRTLSHRTAIITVSDGSKWISDVGFGGHAPLLGPIPFRAGSEFTVFAERYLLEKHETLGYILQWYDQENDKWEDMYCFHDHEYLEVDYDMMNYYISNHPTSLFVNFVFCGLSCEEGTTVLFNDTLSIRRNHKMIKQKVESLEDLARILQEQFTFSNLDENLVRQIFDRMHQHKSGNGNNHGV